MQKVWGKMNLQNYCEAKSCLIFVFDYRILQRQKIKVWKPGSLCKQFLLCHYIIVFYFQAPGEQMFLLCFFFFIRIRFFYYHHFRESSPLRTHCEAFKALFKHGTASVCIVEHDFFFFLRITSWNVETMQANLMLLSVCVDGAVCIQVMLEKCIICLY